MTYYIWVKERNLWCFSLIFTRCQNGKINAHGTCICNENFEEGSLGVCVAIVVPELIPDNKQRTGCAEGYKWNPETAKCEIMVAGFSFIGEFYPITEWSANQHFQICFSTVVYYPDITSPDFATFLYVLLLQKVLSNQEQASNYYWRNWPIWWLAE